MPDNLKVNIDIIENISSSAKAIEDSFISTMSVVTDSLEDVRAQIESLNESVEQIIVVLNNEFGGISLNNLVVEIATVTAGIITINEALALTESFLVGLAGRTILIYFAFQIGWDIGTWFRENVTEPIRIQNENVLQEIVNDVADVSTETLKKLDEIYRQSGDSVRHFAEISASEFESLRSRATGEVEQLRKTLDELEGGPDIPIVRNQIAFTKTLLENGERLLKSEKRSIFDRICEFMRLPVWYNCTRELQTAV